MTPIGVPDEVFKILAMLVIIGWLLLSFLLPWMAFSITRNIKAIRGALERPNEILESRLSADRPRGGPLGL